MARLLILFLFLPWNSWALCDNDMTLTKMGFKIHPAKKYGAYLTNVAQYLNKNRASMDVIYDGVQHIDELGKNFRFFVYDDRRTDPSIKHGDFVLIMDIDESRVTEVRWFESDGSKNLVYAEEQTCALANFPVEANKLFE